MQKQGSGYDRMIERIDVITHLIDSVRKDIRKRDRRLKLLRLLRLFR